jgi:futalosine hydrolase
MTDLSRPILIVVATALEATKLPRLERAVVVVSGIGSVNAALATQTGILEHDPEFVLSVGIGGAYPSGGLKPGDAAVASSAIYAGLGAMDGNEFLNLERLGFPLLERDGLTVFGTLPAAPQSAAFARAAFAEAAHASLGPFLTLETVTGSARVAAALEARIPGALVEGMEGAGVAHAAALHSVPFLEVRGVSNMVGGRDRSAWKIPEALAALSRALEAGWSVLLDSDFRA